MLIQTGLVSALIFLEIHYGFLVILFYVLSVEAIMLFKFQRGIWWLGIFATITVIALMMDNPTNGLVSSPIYLGGYFFFASFAHATAQAEDARKESQKLLEELQQAHLQLQEYSAQAEQLAVAQERNRMAREMHDTVGHRLTVASVQLEGARRLLNTNPEKAEAMVATVQEQVRGALNELRQTVATLREPLEADIPLELSLNRLVENFENATGLPVHLLLPDAFPPLSGAHRLAMYRTVQESLTNIHRHARASQAWVQIECQAGQITLRISDDGEGLTQARSEGFGLRGLQERASHLSGQFTVSPRKGGGTQVILQLPLPQCENNQKPKEVHHDPTDPPVDR